MKVFVRYLLGLSLLLFFIMFYNSSIAQTLQAGYAYEGTGITTTVNNVWEDVTSVTLSMEGATSVMVIGDFNMKVTSGSLDVTGFYRFSDGTNTSAQISRYVAAKTYTDYGIGSLSHIFSYSGDGFTGSKTFTLQHMRTVPGSSKNITSKANIVAIVVDDNTATLPNSVKSTGDVTTTSTTYTEVTGSKTDALTLSTTASIYLSASFSTLGSTSLTGNWVLRKSTDGTTFTEISGASVSRTNSTTVGAAAITYMLTGQTAGTYYFDLAHKTSTGTLTTRNLTIVALGLTGDDNNVYNSFSSMGGSATTSSASSSAALTTSAVTSENNTNAYFFHSTFNMTNNTSNAIALPGFSLSTSTGTFSSNTYNRYLLASGTGSGSLVGLVTDLSYNTAPTISLNHFSDGTNSMTTQNINIVGFQLKSSPVSWTGSTSNDWNNTGNWSTGAIPTESNNVKITSGTVEILESGSATCYDLNVNGGTLTVNAASSSAGSLIVKGTASGSISCNSYIGGSEWHVISPIVEGESINTFITDGNNNLSVSGSNYGMMDYNETSNSWNSYFTSATSGNLESGKGYCVRRDSDGTITYSGTISNGTQTVSLSNAGDGWNCIGNPYTSAIGVNSSASTTLNFITENSANLDASYACAYVWDDASSTYKIVGNVSFGDRDLGQNLFQTGQGFFVKAKDASSTVTFNDSMQAHSNSTTLKSASTSWPGFELVANSANEKTSTIVAFNSEMTNGLDITYDAGLLRGSSGFEIFTQLVEDNGVDFAVQCLPENYNSLVIPIALESKDGGEITFTVEAKDLPESCDVILEDRISDTYTKLLNGGSYKTSIGSGKTDFGRFYIHTSYLTTGALNFPVEEQSEIKVYQAFDKIWIVGKFSSSARVQLFNINGQKIGNYCIKDVQYNSIPCSGMVPGVYLINLMDEGIRIKRKLVIH